MEEEEFIDRGRLASEARQQQKWSELKPVEEADSREETNENKTTYKRVSSRSIALYAFGTGVYKEICALESSFQMIPTCLR